MIKSGAWFVLGACNSELQLNISYTYLTKNFLVITTKKIHKPVTILARERVRRRKLENIIAI